MDEDNVGLDFGTSLEANAFNSWLQRTYGLRLRPENGGKSLERPRGRKYDQRFLNDMRDEWEDLNESGRRKS